MALKGLKKFEQESDEAIGIDDFISGASARVKVLAKKQQNYQRVTFSLTDELSKEIDDLVLNSRVARANRSTIIKAAVHYLQTLSQDELQQYVLNEIK